MRRPLPLECCLSGIGKHTTTYSAASTAYVRVPLSFLRLVTHNFLVYRSTFDLLIADLTRDAKRAQPRDALQYCADWFNARLQEQRSRIRDILEKTANNSSANQPSRLSAPDFANSSTSSRISSLNRQLSMPQILPTQMQRTNSNHLGPLGELGSFTP
jgi:hypothetical protein